MFEEDSGGVDAVWHADFSSEIPSFTNLRADEFARETESWSLQSTDFTCAIVSQKMILQQFGIELSEAQLVYEATSGGFLTSAGTMPEDLGRLLESHGVSTHQSIGIECLLSDLAQGHKVIVAVDSGEIWGRDWGFEDLWGGERADHALVLNGLDLSDPNNPTAVLNDPGHPYGAGLRVPLNTFLDAWNDSGEFFVATDEAPPELSSDPVIGAGYQQEAGMYMTQGYWERFAEARGIVFVRMLRNVDEVSRRFMDEGGMRDAYVAAVVQSITASLADLTDNERDDLFREI